MAVKKSELYSSLWKSCDELRGGMDASQYKDYVLVLLFVKYVSDRSTGSPYDPIQVPPGASFRDMVALKGQKDIGERINEIIARLAEANNLKGVINVADFDDPDKLGQGKEKQDRLSRLVGIFENPALDFSRNRAGDDDLLGDAYEYLMRHFATESGKSKGQFYTPAEVSRIMASVIGIGGVAGSVTIYDPTCGSGSLLLKAADEAQATVTIYGQEMDNATAALAKMNMILHGHPSARIFKGNTLSSPGFTSEQGGLERFDFVVANPPFSTKAWSNGLDPAHDLYERFDGFGIPPAKNGDYAFLLHILKSMKSTGKGAVILPHGVLFRGNAEAEIRENLVRRGFLKAIIGLPANLFYGTGIPACILVLDKEHAQARTGIYMIDASKGFAKDGNKNRLRHRDIHRIVDAFEKRPDVPGFSRMVPLGEIAANGYNLNLPRYIDTGEGEDLHDLTAHLRGGLPVRDVDALDAFWQTLPGVRQALFEDERPGYLRLAVKPEHVKPTILGHDDFRAFQEGALARFEAWQRDAREALRGIGEETPPKALGRDLSEKLLAAFTGTPLVDAYAVYQHFMAYWDATMQDDVYMVVEDGWTALAGKQPNTDLIPEALVVTRYFFGEQQAIDDVTAEAEAAGAELTEMEEEHGGEDGFLGPDVQSDKNKVTKALVKARRKSLFGEPDADDERAVLDAYLNLADREAELKKKAKAMQKKLDAKVAGKYAALTPDEVRVLVVDDKWLATLEQDVQGELARVSQKLTGRVRTLADRYATPLPVLADEVEALTARVSGHLEKMGVAWN